MKPIDLDALKAEEGEALAALDAARAKITSKRRELADQLREEFILKVEDAGLELKDIFDLKTPRKTRKARNDPGHIYQNPDNAEEFWGGRGARPKWLAEKLAAGAVLNDFKIGA